jgi:hypothetical protein
VTAGGRRVVLDQIGSRQRSPWCAHYRVDMTPTPWRERISRHGAARSTRAERLAGVGQAWHPLAAPGHHQPTRKTVMTRRFGLVIEWSGPASIR